MNTNLQSQIPTARGITGEGWAAIVGAVGSAFLLAKKLLSPKGGKSEHVRHSTFHCSIIPSCHPCIPRTLLARAIRLALPATRAVATRKQQKKGK
jgi:hypothetical protein